MLEGKLLQAGLSLNEAKIYIALLNVGKSTLSKLAKKACFGHVTCLYNLRYLMEKGLVICQRENLKNYYYIRNPKHGLFRYLQSIREDYEKKETAINESIEGAEIKYADLTGKPEVKFFEGENVSECAHQEILNTQYNEYFEFTNLDESYKYIPKDSEKRKNLRRRFKADKDFSTLIYTTNQGKIFPKKFKRTTKYFIPKESFDFPGEISIFGEKVILYSFQPNQQAVVIKNKSIAKTLESLFRLAILGTERFKENQNNQ